MTPPDFPTWKRENLDNIAKDMYVKLQHQDEEIKQLKEDLKAAIAAYRQLTIQRG